MTVRPRGLFELGPRTVFYGRSSDGLLKEILAHGGKPGPRDFLSTAKGM